jgi:hypothetical protein
MNHPYLVPSVSYMWMFVVIGRKWNIIRWDNKDGRRIDVEGFMAILPLQRRVNGWQLDHPLKTCLGVP